MKIILYSVVTKVVQLGFVVAWSARGLRRACVRWWEQAGAPGSWDGVRHGISTAYAPSNHIERAPVTPLPNAVSSSGCLLHPTHQPRTHGIRDLPTLPCKDYPGLPRLL